MPELLFLKLGGSLITDKSRPYAPRLERLTGLCSEIAGVLDSAAGGLQLLLGHGSGSFGHTAASQHGTRTGVQGAEAWRGFAEVHHQAAALNRIVMEEFHRARVPAIAFPPSGAVTAREGRAARWDTRPLEGALASGLVPVVYGDVAFDEVIGGTILSTEELFQFLAPRLRPSRILLAGLEAGVWEDFPARTRLVPRITPGAYAKMGQGITGAVSVDVTGGMESKVRHMLDLVATVPGLQVRIFSAEASGDLTRALLGEPLGTLLLL